MRKNIVAVVLGFITGIIIIELLLRIYNPFPSIIKGDKIILAANQKYIFINNNIKKLDKEIIHTKNSLGFRGEDQPGDYKNYFLIITTGGSTTESSLQSDSKT